MPQKNDRLRRALYDADLNVNAFARNLRVDNRTVGRWLAGDTTPRLLQQKHAGELLGLDHRELAAQRTASPTT